MTIIYLIRHAENDFLGENKKLAGWLPGVHLNERGEKQAEALSKYLAKVRFRAVYSSPLERTMETAAPIAAVQNLPIEAREGLGEIHYGTWEGRSLSVLRRRKLWPTIQYIPSLARFPKGESFVEAQARAVAEIEDIRGIHASRKSFIACITHADIIKLILAYYLGLPLDLFQRLSVAPASMSVLQLDQGIRLIKLNDTSAAHMMKDG
ncbi:MAG: phosphoglycerate mutase [Anaerolineales bacterium]|nr:phosphoglycerate mutase [Anaerolineales bacterium]